MCGPGCTPTSRPRRSSSRSTSSAAPSETSPVSASPYDPPVPITVVPTAYGRAASQALRDAVARVKQFDVLAPVTVVVPTNSVGVSARRRLASGELGPISGAGRGGIGVTFVTVYRLSELLSV